MLEERVEDTGPGPEAMPEVGPVYTVPKQRLDMEDLLSSDTVVIGVGNTILSDEGVGVHAARLLQNDPGCPQASRFWTAGQSV